MKKIIIVSAIILAVYLLFFFKLGERSLWDPDEPRYAESAREMIESGDYVTPRFNYEVRFDKPPLVYWLIASSYKIFGISEFAARFPLTLLGLGCVILTYLCGVHLKSRRLGFFSAAILATSIEFLILARACTTDMALCFFITAAIFFFLKRMTELSFLAMALATLTKGPVGFALPALICGALFLVRREKGHLPLKSPAGRRCSPCGQKVFPLRAEGVPLAGREMFLKFFRGIFVFLLVASPWYFLVIAKHGGVYVEKFFLFHHLERFFSKEFQHAEPFYYYLPMLLAGFLPWSLFLPSAIIKAIKRQPFLLMWAGIVVLLFSLAKAKLPTYILPAFPAFALIAGSYLEERKLEKTAFAFAVFVLVLTTAALVRILPAIDVHRSAKAISKPVLAEAEPADKFATYKFFKPSFVYYAKRKVIRLETEEELFKFLSEPGRRFVFFKPSDYNQLKATSALMGSPLSAAGRYVAVVNHAE